MREVRSTDGLGSLTVKSVQPGKTESRRWRDGDDDGKRTGNARGRSTATRDHDKKPPSSRTTTTRARDDANEREPRRATEPGSENRTARPAREGDDEQTKEDAADKSAPSHNRARTEKEKKVERPSDMTRGA